MPLYTVQWMDDLSALVRVYRNPDLNTNQNMQLLSEILSPSNGATIVECCTYMTNDRTAAEIYKTLYNID